MAAILLAGICLRRGLSARLRLPREYLSNLLALMELPTIAAMAYQALLFCADPKISRVLSTLLNQFEFHAEVCSEPFEAVKKLTEQHFDALVVDCDHEQNAALLFKSARNSALNSVSLAIGIVAGQAAITQAFRIGANLVFAKPINVEQTKGTLRVARGLLKKSEQAKASASPEPQAAADTPPSQGPGSVEGAPQPLLLSALEQSETVSVAPGPAPRLEVEEKETAPALGPTEAALLESMPETLPAHPEVGLASEPRAQAKPSPEPVISALESASGPLRPETGGSVAGAASSARSSHSGNAAAATQAKELTPPVPVADTSAAAAPSVEPAQTKSSKPKASGKASSSKASSKGTVESQSFSWHDAAREQDESEDQDSRKNLLVAAVLVLALAGAAYYAWPRLQPAVMSLPFVQRYIAPYLGAAPEAQPAAPARQAAIASKPAADANGSSQTPADSYQESVPGAQTAGTSTATSTDPASLTVGPANTGSTAAAAVPKSAPQAVHVSESAMEGLLLRKVQPTYPADAARMRVEGSVQLQADIAKDGSVASLKSLHGDPMLVRSATDAVRQWKYKPYLINGQPAQVTTEITVKFKLP